MPCRVACGYVESLVLEAPVALSSIGGEIVWVQVVVARGLWQTVVPVQKGFWLVHRLQVVIGLVGFRLEEAELKQKQISFVYHQSKGRVTQPPLHLHMLHG